MDKEENTAPEVKEETAAPEMKEEVQCSGKDDKKRCSGDVRVFFISLLTAIIVVLAYHGIIALVRCIKGDDCGMQKQCPNAQKCDKVPGRKMMRHHHHPGQNGGFCKGPHHSGKKGDFQHSRCRQAETKNTPAAEKPAASAEKPAAPAEKPAAQ